MATGHTHQTDVVIVGAGPVGLFAVFECGMVRLRCHVIDVLDDAGGQCTALYPEKPIYDIPGFPRIEAAELVVRLKAQAAPFRPVYHLGEQVQGLEPLSGGFWKVTTSEGHGGAGARRDHRGRRRRLRSQPAAVAGHRGLRGQERLLLCHPSRSLPRQARGDRGRRRHRRRLGAVAGRDRRPRLGDPSPRQVPRRARERGAAQGARQVGQARSRRAVSASWRWKAPQASSRP